MSKRSERQSAEIALTHAAKAIRGLGADCATGSDAAELLEHQVKILKAQGRLEDSNTD